MHSAPAFAIRRKDVPGIGVAISLVVPLKLSDGETQAMDILKHILTVQGSSKKIAEVNFVNLQYVFGATPEMNLI